MMRTLTPTESQESITLTKYMGFDPCIGYDFTTITLSLPYPPSANRAWRTYTLRTGQVVTVASKEGMSYKKAVRLAVMRGGITKPISGRVRVHVDLYPQRPQDWRRRIKADPERWDDSVRSIDLDNARKVLYDALKNVVFEDDKMVWADSGERKEPDGEARVVVTVRGYKRRNDD